MQKQKVKETPAVAYSLPGPLHEKIADLGKQYGKSPLEVLRQFVKIGILVARVMESPTARLIIEEWEEGNEQETLRRREIVDLFSEGTADASNLE